MVKYICSLNHRFYFHVVIYLVVLMSVNTIFKNVYIEFHYVLEAFYII